MLHTQHIYMERNMRFALLFEKKFLLFLALR